MNEKIEKKTVEESEEVRNLLRQKLKSRGKVFEYSVNNEECYEVRGEFPNLPSYEKSKREVVKSIVLDFVKAYGMLVIGKTIKEAYLPQFSRNKDAVKELKNQIAEKIINGKMLGELLDTIMEDAFICHWNFNDIEIEISEDRFIITLWKKNEAMGSGQAFNIYLYNKKNRENMIMAVKSSRHPEWIKNIILDNVRNGEIDYRINNLEKNHMQICDEEAKEYFKAWKSEIGICFTQFMENHGNDGDDSLQCLRFHQCLIRHIRQQCVHGKEVTDMMHIEYVTDNSVSILLEGVEPRDFSCSCTKYPVTIYRGRFE